MTSKPNTTQPTLKLTDIIRGTGNVRHTPEKIEQMAKSVHEVGILEPLIVAPELAGDGTHTGKYVLVAGSRRFLAAQKEGLPEVPVHVMDLDEQKKVIVGLVENIQREDLNALDMAEAVEKLCDMPGMNQKLAAQKLGKTEGFVSQYVSMMELPRQVHEAVRKGKLGIGLVREFVRIKDDEELLKLLDKAITEKLTAPELRREIDGAKPSEKVFASTVKKVGSSLSGAKIALASIKKASIPTELRDEVKEVTATVEDAVTQVEALVKKIKTEQEKSSAKPASKGAKPAPRATSSVKPASKGAKPSRKRVTPEAVQDTA